MSASKRARPAARPDRVGLVVIGTGGIGKYHLGLWKETPHAEVIGVYDAAPKLTRAAAERFGVRRVYSSLEEAVGNPRADAAVICTPNMFHKESVIAALDAGKHCLCEKPLAATAADIRALIAARTVRARLKAHYDYVYVYGYATGLRPVDQYATSWGLSIEQAAHDRPTPALRAALADTQAPDRRLPARPPSPRGEPVGPV